MDATRSYKPTRVHNIFLYFYVYKRGKTDRASGTNSGRHIITCGRYRSTATGTNLSASPAKEKLGGKTNKPVLVMT
jgi:hypothetical protein